MGVTYAAISLTHLFNKQKVEINALVDTGATFMCVTEEIAVQLGFDTTEVSTQILTLANGKQPRDTISTTVEIQSMQCKQVYTSINW